jgi:hypothetical protein
VIEHHLSGKCEALNSNPSATKKDRQQKRRKDSVGEVGVSLWSPWGFCFFVLSPSHVARAPGGLWEGKLPHASQRSPASRGGGPVGIQSRPFPVRWLQRLGEVRRTEDISIRGSLCSVTDPCEHSMVGGWGARRTTLLCSLTWK